MRPENKLIRFIFSFYGKIATVFILLIGLMGLVLSMVYVRSINQFEQETNQKLNFSLAKHFSKEFAPYVVTKIDRPMIEEKIRQLMDLNLNVEIYLVSNKGMVKAAFLGKNRVIEQEWIDIKPIQRLLRGDKLPILGTDPRKIGRMKPFSVAHIDIMGEHDCYVYVILGSEWRDEVVATLQGSYIWQAGVQWLLGLLILIGILGLFVFRWLTKPMRNLEKTVMAFKEGDQTARVAHLTKCEVGQASGAFNEMADTIQAHVATLKKTDQLRRELIANVSHDLRSPIASIQGYLETIVLKDATLKPEERREFIQTALKNTQRLNVLIHDLFELSKLDAEQIKPEFESFSLSELAQDLVFQLKPAAAQKQVALSLQVPKHLHHVWADIGLVERALFNLIDNAIKYSPNNASVQIVMNNESESVLVSIRDEGIGIPEEDLPHIFERFYRVDKSRARSQEGTGLGLAIAQKILHLHGSMLKVTSKLDQGTTFSFILPIA
jgi:signal transduction histidine kinase